MKLRCGPFVLATVFVSAILAYAQSGTPVVSDVKVSHITSSSVTIAFSSVAPSFAGVSYQPVGGAWTTVNEAYGVNHTVTISGLTPGTQYNYIAWASGAPKIPVASFRTPAPGEAPATSGGEYTGDGGQAGTTSGKPGILVWGAILLVLVVAGLAILMFLRRRAKLNSKPQGFDSWKARSEVSSEPPIIDAEVLPAESFLQAEEPDYLASTDSYLDSGVKTAVEVDAELMRRAQKVTGISNKAVLVSHALEALIQSEGSRHEEGNSGFATVIRPER
jgi:hypothetical protein